MTVINVEMDIVWLTGILTAMICLAAQIFIYFLIPKSRSLALKILTQLTVARLLDSLFEFIMLGGITIYAVGFQDAVFALYLQSNAAMILWMYVFTQNLYNQVIVFPPKDWNFLLVSVLVWTLTLPVGVLCPIMLSKPIEEFLLFYQIYGYVKFCILIVNLLLFTRIFVVAICKKDRQVGILKTYLFSFVLVSIISLQVLATDIVSFFFIEEEWLYNLIVVINSYQAVVITSIFVVFVNNLIEDTGSTVIKTVARYLFQCKTLYEIKRESITSKKTML